MVYLLLLGALFAITFCVRFMTSTLTIAEYILGVSWVDGSVVAQDIDIDIKLCFEQRLDEHINHARKNPKPTISQTQIGNNDFIAGYTP